LKKAASPFRLISKRLTFISSAANISTAIQSTPTGPVLWYVDKF